MLSGKVSPMSHNNGLDVFPLEGRDYLKLSGMENMLVAKHILFQMYVQLPKSRWSATKKQMVTIPIFDKDVEETLSVLPRTPDQASVCKVKLKRKKSLKSSHFERFISVENLLKSVLLFKELKNPHYENISVADSYIDYVQANDPQGYDDFFLNLLTI